MYGKVLDVHLTLLFIDELVDSGMDANGVENSMLY